MTRPVGTSLRAEAGGRLWVSQRASDRASPSGPPASSGHAEPPTRMMWTRPRAHRDVR